MVPTGNLGKRFPENYSFENHSGRSVKVFREQFPRFNIASATKAIL